MAEEAVETTAEAKPELTVEVASDDSKKPELTDEEVAKLDTLPPEDEIGRYAQTAQKRIQALHVANQEWRRRVTQSNKDIATATNLAQQLYQENQELRATQRQSENALIGQALERTEAQLAQARLRARAAYGAQNLDEILAANEEVARAIAEADRLRLLKTPATSGGEQHSAPASSSASPARPQAGAPGEMTSGTRSWLQRNPWFGKPGEEKLSGFAMGVHQSLEKQGITEASNPSAYWAAIDRELKEAFPQRFADAAPKESNGRPLAVTGATRTNGAATGGKRSARHVVLSESQVRIAHNLGLSPEQYAAELVKESREGT